MNASDGNSVKSRPVVKRLMPPLTALIVIVSVLAMLMQWFTYRQYAKSTLQEQSQVILNEFQTDLQHQAATLKALALVVSRGISGQPSMGRHINVQDNEKVQKFLYDMFAELSETVRLTHFNLIDRDGLVWLRMHRPELYGDVVDRAHIHQSARSGQPEAGFLIGLHGGMAVRVAIPLYTDGEMSGFLELGREICTSIYERHLVSGVHLAATVLKDWFPEEAVIQPDAGLISPYNDQSRSMACISSFDDSWDLLPNSVFVYSSLGNLPDDILQVIEYDPDMGQSMCDISQDVRYDDRIWRLSVQPYYTFDNQRLGCLFVMADVTGHYRRFIRQLWQLFLLFLVLLCALVLTYFLLHRTDRYINRQHRELLKAKHQEELASRVKTDFLTMVSHEVRTPLNAIIGFTGLLDAGYLEPEQREYLHSVHQAGMSLLRVVDSILDFSRLEQGGVDYRLEPINLVQLVENAVGLLRTSAEDKGLLLNYRFSDKVPECIISDPQALRQILVNLLDNAVDFTESGRVELAIEYSGQNADGRLNLQFAVRDTGIGLSEQQLLQLFSGFWQADLSLRREHGGIGLGLAISKQLAEGLGGRLDVESDPGRGSCFSLVLYCQACQASDMALMKRTQIDQIDTDSVVPETETQISNNKTVLIVEDDMINMRLSERLIQKSLPAVHILKAGDGQQALDLLYGSKNTRVDCVLMDIHMPILDGLEACRQIRQHELDSGQHLPVIALTANTMDEHRRDCYAAGMDDFLPKPVAMERLIEALKRYLDS